MLYPLSYVGGTSVDRSTELSFINTPSGDITQTNVRRLIESNPRGR